MEVLWWDVHKVCVPVSACAHVSVPMRAHPRTRAPKTSTPERHAHTSACLHTTVPSLGPSAGEAHPLRPYWEYLSYLFRKLPVLSSDEQLEADYRDYLQAPLQPLQVSVMLSLRHASQPL